MQHVTFTHWVHPWDHPFLFQFNETFGVRYYGLAYALGFLIGGWLLHVYAKRGRSPLTTDQSSDFLLVLAMGVLIGGRLGHFVLYETATLLRDPFAFFRVWEGGMASHGGFAGVAVAIIVFAQKQKIRAAQLGDLAATITAPGLLLGRVANFINGELWGKPSDVPWAVIFPQSAPGLPIELIAARHPSQLYQAALEGAVLLVFIQWRFWRSDVAKKMPGRLMGEFLVAYAILRSAGEIFREPDAALILGLNPGAFYSVLLGAAGLILAWSASRKKA